MMPRRFAGALAAAVTVAGLLATGALPAQAAQARGAAPAQAPQARAVMRTQAASQARAAMPGMDLRAGLHGSHAYPHAGGSATYRPGDDGRMLEVHVGHLGHLAGHRLAVYVHGRRAGMMRVDHRGRGHMGRDHGVPVCRPGQAVRIRTSAGILVASGTFSISRGMWAGAGRPRG